MKSSNNTSWNHTSILFWMRKKCGTRSRDLLNSIENSLCEFSSRLTQPIHRSCTQIDSIVFIWNQDRKNTHLHADFTYWTAWTRVSYYIDKWYYYLPIKTIKICIEKMLIALKPPQTMKEERKPQNTLK